MEIFDLKASLEAVHNSAAMAEFIKNQKEAKPLFSFSGHMTEGFAIDWSPKVPGKCFALQLCSTLQVGSLWYKSEGLAPAARPF